MKALDHNPKLFDPEKHTRVTPLLQKAYNESKDPDKFLKYIMDKIQKLYDLFEPLNWKSRAKALHKQVDDAIKYDIDKFKGKISCKKGCSHCCHIPVDIWDEEAKLLANLMIRKKIKYNKEELQIQKNMNTDDFHKGNYRPCIFLKDNQCQVYEHRPIACRKQYVTSPPMDCAVELGVKKHTTAPVLMSAEMVYSAFSNASNWSDGNTTMGYMIDKTLRELK